LKGPKEKLMRVVSEATVVFPLVVVAVLMRV